MQTSMYCLIAKMQLWLYFLQYKYCFSRCIVILRNLDKHDLSHLGQTLIYINKYLTRLITEQSDSPLIVIVSGTTLKYSGYSHVYYHVPMLRKNALKGARAFSGIRVGNLFTLGTLKNK